LLTTPTVNQKSSVPVQGHTDIFAFTVHLMSLSYDTCPNSKKSLRRRARRLRHA
jgi:hypothetical protein